MTVRTFTKIEMEALDLLSMAPSSFAALYRWVRSAGPETTAASVHEVMAAILRLVDEGVIKLAQMLPDGPFRKVIPSDITEAEAQYEDWLGGRPSDSIPVDETSYDHVGLWCDMTEHGRSLWEKADAEREREDG